MHADNPAARLFLITQSGQALDKSGTTRAAWSTLLSSEAEVEAGVLPLPVLVARLAGVIALPGAIRNEVERLENVNKELLVRYLHTWDSAFEAQMQLQGQWNGFIVQFTEAHMVSLENCADVLSRYSAEPVLEDEFLQELVSELDGIFEKVVGAGIDAGVREYLLRNVELLRHGIHMYRASGIRAVEDAVEGVVGSMLIELDLASGSYESDEGKKFWSTVRRLGLLISTVSGAFKLGEAITQNLPMLTK